MPDRGERPSTRSRFRGALLGVAIGDALGAPLEGGPRQDVAKLWCWVESPPEPLRYTDDTHMTIATARSLIEHGRCRGQEMAEALAAQWEREPWRGYGAGPPRVFDRLRRGWRWDEAARDLFSGKGSFGNGAAMRVAPIGLLHHGDAARAALVARAAARITHTHPIGEDGAALQAAAVAELLAADQLEPMQLVQRLRPHVRTRRMRELLDDVVALGGAPSGRAVRVLGNGIEAHRSVPTALYCFLRNRRSFTGAVLFALSLGGDADTIASMTGALAGAYLGEGSIPATWADRVEDGDELRELADRLLDCALAAA